MIRALLLLSAVATAGAIGACNMATPPTMLRLGTTTGASSHPPATIDPPSIAPDTFTTLKDPADAHAELCAPDDQHPNFPDDADIITMTFCQDLVDGGVIAAPRSLADLQKQLGLDFKSTTSGNGTNGNPGFAILGHSSALTARKVSSLTPTTFVFTPPPADGSKPTGQYAVLAFDPGEQFVEVAAHDPAVDSVNFYVVFFEQACTTSDAGCTENNLLTPELVTGWSNLRTYEDTSALGDTIFDCHVCHQPDNSGNPFLRMQEIEAPFTHWFSSATVGGKALLADFHAAHGTSEDYGGIPAALIDQSDPSKLAALIKQAGFADQPNAFASVAIESEVTESSGGQPSTNVPMGTSATWASLYAGAVSGSFIATPYHDVKVTDPTKLASMTAAYRDWVGGSKAELPDLRDVFLDDGLRDMGFAPQDGADGPTLLKQMCEECHNSKLDMTVSREKFLVDQLDQMSRVEKDLAIQRLGLPASTRLRMPPMLFRTITDDERQLMIETLQQ
jgi:hypothetical protein